MLFVHPSRVFSSNRRGDDLTHIGNIDTVSGDLAAIDIDRDVWLAEELLNLQIFDTSNRAEHSGNVIPCLTQALQVGPEYFHRHLSAHSRNQFVHPLLDRLTD